LNAARKNAAKYGVGDAIAFHLADGIPPALAPELDCVIVAGMGGETITGILERAESALPAGTLLILQPQTKTDVLLAHLNARGYSDLRLAEVTEGRRKYVIVTARKG
jgi:tRNA (adenine22-N1)-methyltransferase